MPNGEIVTLDSIKKMQEDIGKKFDKTGGRVTGSIISERNINAEGGLISAILGDVIVQLKSTGGYPSILSTYDNKKFNELKLPDSSGVAMTLGQSGWGGKGQSLNQSTEDELRDYLRDINTVTSVFRNSELSSSLNYQYSAIAYFKTSNAYMAITASHRGQGVKVISGSDIVDHIYNLWTDRNTTVDPQGFIKKASPIVNINSDGTFITNDESEGATVTRVAQGEYLIEGVLGFNSDAGWGGVDGGIEIPLDVNKQPLIWVNSKVNKDGSILVTTYHRTHPNAPEFANNKIGGFNDGDPIDIPAGRFISVRVQMPEQSIYNVRMREMEDAQKAEEERRQKEEEENQDTDKTPEIDN
ncbi:phage tail fiber protein, partial [Proteus sp. G2672]|uniref:phage tail fiber protein n=1 Tax=Proteus sp. G2672 TaxID=2698884 RepID=UPI00192A01DD